MDAMSTATKTFVVLAGFLCGFGCVSLYLNQGEGLPTSIAMVTAGLILLLVLWTAGKLRWQ